MRRAWVLAGVFALGCQRRDDLPRPDLVVATHVAAPVPAGVTVEELAPSILLHIDGVEGIILRKQEPPTVAEAIAFERGLATAIAKAKPGALGHLPAGLSELKRIYFARVQDGLRIVGAHMYCIKPENHTWTLEGYQMFDGGDCNVLAWYVPETREYRLHGDARPVTMLSADGS